MKRHTFMVIEHFRNGDARPVYDRFRARGRMAPEGLAYIASWTDIDLHRCYQVMETDSRALLEEWMTHWQDLVDFEVLEVVTSDEAARRALEW
jgi:hypothetical protein